MIFFSLEWAYNCSTAASGNSPSLTCSLVSCFSIAISAGTSPFNTRRSSHISPSMNDSQGRLFYRIALTTALERRVSRIFIMRKPNKLAGLEVLLNVQ
ncbi:UNVERIFIED_ORG: hypothetical protein J2Y76_002272 [Pseudomonas reinekei]|nr:hypothetical protein [Pseudomonas reinekei]